MTISALYDLFLQCSGISTDTRNIGKDSLFFALKGANFNGNTFALQAIENGAKYAVVDEAMYATNDKIILVNEVLSALQQLANFHRRTFDIPFIAITGSNGKTTTKELVNAVLEQKYKTYATKGNLNNHIGIPLTLLAITRDVEIAIIEMGANHQEEIEGYCQYTEPTHGLITNIGKAHLEGFGGIEGVKKGKGELYDYLLTHHGKGFLCTTNETLMQMSKFANPITYPQANDFYSCKFIEAQPYIRLQAEDGTQIPTHLAGAYNFDNIAVALCIGKFFGVDAHAANKAIAQYDPQNNRSQITQTERNAIVMDCYNANPTSMKAALESFDGMKADNKVVIIGDMYELGNESAAEHAAIGSLLLTMKFDKIILCGKEMNSAAAILGTTAIHFTQREALEIYLKENPMSKSTILLKASRSMALEKLLGRL